MMPEYFLTTHRVFTRAELQSALHGRAVATVDSHISRWRRQGRIARVKRGVFVRLDQQGVGNDSLPDFVTLASRMASDAAVAYHTALEVHGCAQSLLERFTFVTWTGTKATTYLGTSFLTLCIIMSLMRPVGSGERSVIMESAGQVQQIPETGLPLLPGASPAALPSGTPAPGAPDTSGTGR